MDVTDFLPNGFELRPGKGGGDPRQGLCFLETVALIAGEKVTDHPQCACPVLTSYGISLNDNLDAADRQRLLPLAWATAGTRSEEHERTRLEILGRAACDIALMVQPLYQAKYPADERARKAIEASLAYWHAAAARAGADKSLRARIIDRAIMALRDAIEAGPNGGLPDELVRTRIDAVRELLPVHA